MFLEHRVGDLLEADLPAIAHGVNCKGVMGAGIAKAIRSKFPISYSKYAEICSHNDLQPGQIYVRASNAEPVLLYNLASQNKTGADARLPWLRRALLRMILDAEDRGIREIGLPRIGAGIGGLVWETEVLPLLERVQAVTTVQLIVYSLEV